MRRRGPMGRRGSPGESTVEYLIVAMALLAALAVTVPNIGCQTANLMNDTVNNIPTR